jgi:hypothetical protein
MNIKLHTQPTRLSDLKFHPKVNYFLENQNYLVKSVFGRGIEIFTINTIHKIKVYVDSLFFSSIIYFYIKRGLFWKELPLNDDEEVALEIAIRYIYDAKLEYMEIEREKIRESL